MTMIALSLLVVLLVAGLDLSYAVQCSQDCVCIPNVRSQCGNTTTVINWSSLLQSGSTAVVDVVPGSFSYGGHITLLDLSDNPTLTVYNESFTGLINLITLNLSGCGLISLPDQLFTATNKLEHLDLSDNALTFVNPAAFEGLSTLRTLHLSNNALNSFPDEQLQPLLEQLTTLYLSSNFINCSDGTTLDILLEVSNIIAEFNLLRCTNGTRVQELVPDVPTPSITMVMSTSYIVTPTSTSMGLDVSPIVSIAMSTSYITTTQEKRPSSSSITITSTPVTAVPVYCAAETTLTTIGFLDWPRILEVTLATVPCPSNEITAGFRQCLSGGVWGMVNDSPCGPGSPAVQVLAIITQTTITVHSSAHISQQLVDGLTSDLTLTSRELGALAEVARQLVDVSVGNVETLNNTLAVLNTVLLTSSEQLTTSTSQQLRSLIDTVLLRALSTNHTHLLLTYSHLAVGGAYIPASNQSSLLAFIRLQNTSIGLEIGGEGADSPDVTVTIDGGEGGVQVTVYEGDDLFNQSNCSNATGKLGGIILTPIISVSNENPAVNEVVTISYSHVTTSQGHTTICVRWTPLNCGGGVWSSVNCALVTSSTGQLQCRCLHAGTYAVLDVPVVAMPTDDQFTMVSQIIFHLFLSLPLLLYLTLAITILATGTLRSLPVMQCVCLLSLSQGLSTLVLQLTLPQPPALCYTLAGLTHYTALVTLSLMVVYPVLKVLKVYKMIWYEKRWLIAPFAAVALMWPAIPVGVYSGLRHSDWPQAPELCWFEWVSFPNTFTYISGATAVIVIVTTSVTLVLLACSDYTLQASIYLEIISSLVNCALYCGTLTAQFFTASSSQFSGVSRDQLLLTTGALGLLSGVYLFLSYGLAQSRVRSAMRCREDPLIRSKINHYSNTSQIDSGFNSRSSPTATRNRRPPVRLTDELNINYVDDYLGHNHGNNPVPLAMLGVVGEGGRVSGRQSQLFSNNPLYNHINLSQQL